MTQQGVPIEGLPRMRKQFKELSDKMQRRVLRGALRAAARPVLKDAKARVPVRTGALKKAIGVAVTVKTVESTATIGVRRKRPGQPARRAHLVEFGTKHTSARPFLRPALDSKKEAVVRTLAEALKKQIDTETAKVAQRG